MIIKPQYNQVIVIKEAGNLPVSAHSVVQKTSMMSLPATQGSVHYFYGGKMSCVMGLRVYWGTELNNVILIN